MSLSKKIAKLIADGKESEVDALIEAHTENEVKGLKSKNADLLGDKKKLKESESTLTERLEALEKDKEDAETKALDKSGDIKAIKEQLQLKHDKEMEKVVGERDDAKGQLSKHVVSGGLTQALIKANVNPDMIDAATAVINQNFKGEVGNNDGTPFAKFDGQAVNDFVADWAGTDSGKRFVLADKNNGGGSNGANGNGKAGNDQRKTMSRSEFDGLSATAKMELSTSKEGVTLTDD